MLDILRIREAQMKMRILIKQKRCIPVKVEANWFRGGQRGEGCLLIG